MRISREEFINYMDELREAIDFSCNFSLLADGYWPPGSALAVDLLQKLCDDRYEWISWYVYELDFGRAPAASPVIELEDGQYFLIPGVGELYDLLETYADYIEGGTA